VSVQVYADGVLREQWDDGPPRVYTAWDANGVIVEGTPRDYTAEENAAADAAAAQAQQAANKSTIETNLEQDYLNMQAIEGQSNADLRADPSQEIKDIARAVRRLTRMALENYSGTD
jgi:aminoglycoside phosphotransferase